MSDATQDAREQSSPNNGKKSAGPASAEGKAVAAMNGVRHGLASSSVLLPSETITDYQANIDAWAATLQPSSAGEVAVIARVADFNFRLQRLQRLEDRHMTASLESKLRESAVSRMLGIAQNASLGMSAMVATVGEIRRAQTGPQMARLLPPIRTVLSMVDAVELPASVTAPLARVHEDLKSRVNAAFTPVEIFIEFARLGAELAEALNTKIADLEAKVVAERERIADDLLLGDDKELMKFERHRARINKALDAELARLKIVRELSLSTVGSSVGPILVELKVLGRRQ